MRKIRLLTPQGEKRRVVYSVPILIFLSLITAGCTGVPAMLDPSSVSAARVADLTWSILAIATAVFLVVEALLLYTAFRYKRRPGAEMPKQITGNVPLEIAWTSFPAIVLAVVFALTLGTLLSIANSPAPVQSSSQPTEVVNVRVIGHRWWWEFQYPDLDITTANEMHIPVGATVNLQLESVDVIHSFWVPELGTKKDAIPGLVNHIWYRATRPGRYGGACSAFCGQQHSLMRLQVVAESPEEFLDWVENQQAPAVEVTGVAAEGREAFLASPCTGCHAIEGTSAVGKSGPDLTHYGSRARFAGASFENNLENVTAWIMDPQELKPGNLMPDLGMTSGVSAKIAEYLLSLK